MGIEVASSASAPSQLRITDLRIANLTGVPFRSTVLRLDTNQGLSGYGEVRDGASATYALMLKSRILGQNPCQIEKIFRDLEQFGGHARLGGGISGIEMALCDLAGKAYGLPAYMLIGGKQRDEVLVYADTKSSSGSQQMAQNLRDRLNQGFQFLKMDLGIDLLRRNGIEGGLSYPPGMLDTTNLMHPFTGIRLTPKGIDFLTTYVDSIRSEVGYKVALAVDHVGHLGIESCIELGRALGPFALAWLEDLIPWQLTDQWARITGSLTTPTCTGEDIYLRRNFEPLITKRAVSVIHPDLATAGGILETKKIGALAFEHGIPMALHSAGSPIAFLAGVHCAAASEGFLALEHHAVDVPGWEDLLDGIPKPLVKGGYARIPEEPGLGFSSLNEAAMEGFLDQKYQRTFDMPTVEWDQELAHDRLWS